MFVFIPKVPSYLNNVNINIYYIQAEAGEDMARAEVYTRNAREYCKEQRDSTLLDSQAATCTTDTILRSKTRSHSIKKKREKRKALYLDTGQTHMVWKPKHSKKKEATGFTDDIVENRLSLLDRQQKLLSRVEATRKVLKAQKEELATLEEESNSDNEENSEAQQPTRKDGKKWQNAIARVMEDNSKRNKKEKSTSKTLNFHDIVSQYMSAMSASAPKDGAWLTTRPDEVGGAALYSSQQSGRVRATTMSLREWKSQVFEDQKGRKRHMKACFSESTIGKRL